MYIGYVRIEVEGYYIEKFINECRDNKIHIWNIKKEKGVKLYLNIGIRDFKRLAKICKKTRCKVKIKNKRGIPFFLHRYKKRKFFLIFLILIFLIIFISSRYIWNIDIEINEDQILEGIEEDLEELGLKKGISKNDIDTNAIINEIRLKRDDISWMGIDIKGTNLIIKFVKADETPEIIDNSDYCNIVAEKSGIITKIIAQNGTPVVSVGDTVEEGQILVAGFVEGKYTEPRYVHSLRRS